MITGILCTIRKEPCFDWMADSLVHNLRLLSQNHPNVSFELIVVDGQLWYEPNRREKLSDAVRGRFSFRHVEPKPCAWQGPHRITKRDYYGLCNARNTGLAFAQGQRIVLLDDCSVLDETFLEHHYWAHLKKVAVAGAFRSYTKAEVVDGQIGAHELHPSGIDKRAESATPCSGGWMYGLNVSFSIEMAEAVNGYEEFFDGQGGSEDCHFGIRVEKAGFPVYYYPDCIVHQILEHHEPVCETSAWGRPQPRPQKERVLGDGKPHFANEFLIQEWFKKPYVRSIHGGTHERPEFDLHELRKTGKFPTVRATTHDWRDGQPLAEME